MRLAGALAGFQLEKSFDTPLYEGYCGNEVLLYINRNVLVVNMVNSTTIPSSSSSSTWSTVPRYRRRRRRQRQDHRRRLKINCRRRRSD